MTVIEQPLAGMKVLDFTTLLPGPLATLILAEAGADVVKIERPDGEDMRKGLPKWGEDAARFALLNAGKKSLFVDLKNPDDRRALEPMLADADILVEQFRPGVMGRLGLDYETLKAVNPRLIYCSITGYGQTGPLAARAGHDLNYMSESGILALNPGHSDAPQVPPVLAADIGGGTYPAVMNVLLAVLRRNTTGQGMHIDISMTDNLFPFGFWAIAMGLAQKQWPGAGAHILSGGSPRYGLHKTSDGALIAVGAIEEKFWQRFCDVIELGPDERDDSEDPRALIEIVRARIAEKPAAYWEPRLLAADCCCNVVATLEDAIASEHVRARGIFDYRIEREDGDTLQALPVPLDPALRRPVDQARSAPVAAPAPGGTAKPFEW